MLKLPDKPGGSNRRGKRAGSPVYLKPLTLVGYSSWMVRIDPQKMLSAEVLRREMRFLRTPFTNRFFRLPLNCTTCLARPPQTCRIILDQMADLNEWFWLLGTEITEVEPGVLAFGDLDEDDIYSGDPALLRLASILLHCLLTRHRCLKVLGGLRDVLVHEHRLLFDGIKNSAVLTTIRVKGCELRGDQMRGLVAAIKRKDRIEEFSCDECTFKGSLRAAQDTLAAYLASTTSLRAFRLTYVPLFNNPRTLVKALEKNESIRVLHLDSSVMSIEAGDTFLKYLMKNRTIVELTLVRDVFQRSPGIDVVFQALMENSTLEKLFLHHFEMDVIVAMKFARMVNQPTSGLREASFLCCNWDFLQLGNILNRERHWEIHRLVSELGPNWRILPFVRAVESSNCLEKLSLHMCLNGEESRQLLAAANRSHCLEQLSFDTVSMLSFKPPHTGRVTGATMKVLLGKGNTTPTPSLSTRWDRYSVGGRVSQEGHYRFYNSDTPTFRQVCTGLPGYDCVTTLELWVDTWKEERLGDSAATIARYVSSTKVLKEMHLLFSASEQSAHIMIQGLSTNKTIEKLRIEGWSVNSEDIDVLCQWVAASKTVYHLVYVCNHYESCQALVECAEDFLANSYGLTYMRIADYEPFFDAWRNIKNFLRRNMALVDSAVQFVLGTNVKRAAAALERVSWHPQVAYRLKQKTALTMPEVKQKIRASLKQVLMNFWQVSGVVKEELTCYERDDGRRQIDDLGIDVWLHIRSFLNVGDVLDSKVEKKRSRKRKRC